jgi:hypothetical protein
MPSTQLVTGALHVCCMCAACVLQAASLRIAEVDYSDEDSIAAAIPKGAKVVVVEGDVVGGRKTDAKVRGPSAWVPMPVAHLPAGCSARHSAAHSWHCSAPAWYIPLDVPPAAASSTFHPVGHTQGRPSHTRWRSEALHRLVRSTACAPAWCHPQDTAKLQELLHRAS